MSKLLKFIDRGQEIADFLYELSELARIRGEFRRFVGYPQCWLLSDEASEIKMSDEKTTRWRDAFTSGRQVETRKELAFRSVPRQAPWDRPRRSRGRRDIGPRRHPSFH